ATDEQLDFPVVYGSAKNNWMGEDYKKPTDNIHYLFEKIIEYIPDPIIHEGTVQMLVTSLDFSQYIGRYAIGRLHRGVLKSGQQVSLIKRDGSSSKHRVKELFVF